MEFTAEARFMRVSPQKARLVCDLIKGRRVEDALNTLAYSSKRVSPDIHKVLRSAIQNANYLSQEKGLEVDVDNLVVKNAIANEGPRMKRIRPAPQGRAFRYQRRMSHISITLTERAALGAAVETAGPSAGKAAGKTAATSAAKKKSTAKKKAGR